jgi:hypothetical protein
MSVIADPSKASQFESDLAMDSSHTYKNFQESLSMGAP